MPTLVSAALQATPAPAVPPEVQRAYDKMTQCLYLLRRAHIGGRLSQPIKVLAGADLLNQAGVHFEDAVYETQGVARWLRYIEVWSSSQHLPWMGSIAAGSVKGVFKAVAMACRGLL